jgi:hypothetical protein
MSHLKQMDVPLPTGECPMTLTEELDRVNLTKSELAERLGVNRKTIQRMGEEITDEVRKILNASKEPKYDWVKVPPDLMEELKKNGRGVPVDGYVLVATKDSSSFGSVVSEEAWRARLDWTCKHGREGWSCKECLK